VSEGDEESVERGEGGWKREREGYGEGEEGKMEKREKM
jgi:hypothetical protein